MSENLFKSSFINGANTQRVFLTKGDALTIFGQVDTDDTNKRRQIPGYIRELSSVKSCTYLIRSENTLQRRNYEEEVPHFDPSIESLWCHIVLEEVSKSTLYTIRRYLHFNYILLGNIFINDVVNPVSKFCSEDNLDSIQLPLMNLS